MTSGVRKRRIRLILRIRDGGRCGICHREVRPEEGSIDHIIPFRYRDHASLKNRDGWWNLQYAHHSCNLHKQKYIQTTQLHLNIDWSSDVKGIDAVTSIGEGKRRADLERNGGKRFDHWRRYLRMWESGMKVAEIAKIMGTSRQAVDARLRKALRAKERGWI